jgi:hypothetical protein
LVGWLVVSEPLDRGVFLEKFTSAFLFIRTPLVSNDCKQEHVPAGLSRREALKAGAALVATPLLGGVTSIMQVAEAASAGLSVDRPGQAHTGEARGSTTEWSNYSGNKAGSKVFAARGKQFIVVATGGSNLPAELIALCLT